MSLGAGWGVRGKASSEDSQKPGGKVRRGPRRVVGRHWLQVGDGSDASCSKKARSADTVVAEWHVFKPAASDRLGLGRVSGADPTEKGVVTVWWAGDDGDFLLVPHTSWPEAEANVRSSET